MNKKLCTILLALASTPTFADTIMRPMPVIPCVQQKLLIFEAGASYSHAFYNNSAFYPDSISASFPSGVTVNPDDFYPSNFWGGYIGLSYYVQDWLLNSRYNMFALATKTNASAGTDIRIAPSKLSFTVDRVFGDINHLSYGVGAGTVIESVNKGEFLVTVEQNNPTSDTFNGKTIMNPLVEGFVMYRFCNNVGVKFNLEYQIPLNNKFSDGDLNATLGVNYSFAV